jgi:hypothetical protein
MKPFTDYLVGLGHRRGQQAGKTADKEAGAQKQANPKTRQTSQAAILRVFSRCSLTLLEHTIGDIVKYKYETNTDTGTREGYTDAIYWYPRGGPYISPHYPDLTQPKQVPEPTGCDNSNHN